MKHKYIYSIIASLLTVGFGSSCEDFLDQKSAAYDTNGFFETESGIKDGVSGIYALFDYNFNYQSPFQAVLDTYTGYGIDTYSNSSSIGDGTGLNPDNSYVKTFWSISYQMIARANSVIDGGKNVIANLSTNANQYYAEARLIRAYAYYNLISTYGDVPFFTAPISQDEYMAGRTNKEVIVDFLLAEIDDIAEKLPWTATERGRVDRSVAYGLKSRIALYAGSYNLNNKANEYFRMAADAAQEVMNHRGLAADFNTLFNVAGQKLADVRDELLWEIMYSTQSTKHTHWVGYAHSSRHYGSSVRWPNTMLADTYECKDGLRIDESPLYDVHHPTKNRDPRMKTTMAGHGDTINYSANGVDPLKMIINVYDDQTRYYPSPRKTWYSAANEDVTQSATSLVNYGNGYCWRKYADEVNEQLSVSSVNIIIMRAAEMYLTYAEAKIELGEYADQTVIYAINAVRKRAGMPEVSADRIGNQDKLRQLVRRERKVELAMEGVLFVDVRRWGIADMLNEFPAYGFPKKEIRYEGLEDTDKPNFKTDARHDLNDIPNYNHYSDKLTVRCSKRFWADKFRWWPIPQSECNHDPNLSNPDYE